MSFILDALKKSETDRQQQGSAEFSGVPTSPQSPSVPRWLWIVGVLLTVNLAVLIGLLVRPDSTTPQAVLAETQRVAAPPVVDVQPEPSFEDKVATARDNPPERQLPQNEVREKPKDTVEPVLISQNPSEVPASSLYPTLQEVRARGTIDIPDLHLDIHVFSPAPADRFVFVNMSKLREGSTLAEGPVITEITPDGVVLRHEGQVFLLPRE